MSDAAIHANLDSALTALPPGAIAVAFSGGVDSSVLLHALAQLPEARRRGLRAVHIDHGLHADSANWAAHCRATAARLDVPIEIVRVEVDLNQGTGPEDAARRARMAAFAAQLRADELLSLAQHRDDQVETVLLKLLRGAGPEGLAGMHALRACGSGWLWRPLLDVARADLRAYAQAHSLQWIEDPSNTQTHLRRNFLRGEILPRLALRWPDADAAIAHSAQWARAAADFIDAEARKSLARLQGLDPATLSWRGWLDLPDALRDPVLRLWLRDLHRDEPAHFHVVELERQLREAGADRLPCVRFADTELRRYRDLLYAMPAQPVAANDWQVDWDGAPFAVPGGGTIALDPPRTLPQPLGLRHRRGGEEIKPAGSTHTRELRVLLQEAGIPPWQRARLPLIYRSDELIAVADLFLSDAGEAFLRAIDARIVWTPDAG